MPRQRKRSTRHSHVNVKKPRAARHGQQQHCNRHPARRHAPRGDTGHEQHRTSATPADAPSTMPASPTPPIADPLFGFSEVERDFFLNDFDSVEPPHQPKPSLSDRFHAMICDVVEHLRHGLQQRAQRSKSTALPAPPSADSAAKESR